MLHKQYRKRRMTVSKFVILLLFFFSVSFTSYNLFWLAYGLFSVDELEITKEAADLGQKVFQAPTVKKVKPKKSKKQPLKIGEQYAYLLIPKLEKKIAIYYGANEEQLKQGIGQVERTAMPGEKNNIVLSGHRDTFFRNLGKLEKGDLLIIETKDNSFTYKIKKIRILDKEDRSVIVPKPKATLTLITCYPFGFIGNAPQRYVLIADLIHSSH